MVRVFRILGVVAAMLTLSGCANVGKDPVVLAMESGEYAEAWAYELPRANAGVTEAQLRVAVMYKNGWGRTADMAEAVKFALLARRKGENLPAEIAPALSGIIQLANEQDRAEGQRRAETFVTTPLSREWYETYKPQPVS